jgi:hypothetical protein
MCIFGVGYRIIDRLVYFIIYDYENCVLFRQEMKAVIATVGVLVGVLCVTCCIAYGPFQLPDGKIFRHNYKYKKNVKRSRFMKTTCYTIYSTSTDRSSPPPTYDFDGYNITLREGDIINRGGDEIGQAAAVGVPWKNGRIPYVIDCSISKCLFR